jgi:hypothetical protein
MLQLTHKNDARQYARKSSELTCTPPPPPIYDESQPTLTGAIMWDISLPATTQNIAVLLPDFGEKYSPN